MNTKPLWTFPLTLVVCVGAGLLVVWALSRQLGFSFNPSIVAAISVASIAAAYAISHR